MAGHRGGYADLTHKLVHMPTISGGNWAAARLRHLRELLEQTEDEDERRKIQHEIEQLAPEARLGRRFLRMLLPGMK